VRFGLDVPVNGQYADPRLLAELAADAEAAGWDGFFLQDVLQSLDPVADPWICIAAAALRTHQVRLGVFLTPLTRRRPWQVARQAATIDQLSAGRLLFGAALGYSELDFTPFGETWDARIRAEQLDEALEIVAGLWSGSSYSFAGRHYRLQDVVLRPRPRQLPRIPIWLAAGWPRRRPVARAARWDGVYLMTVHQETQQLLTPADVAEVVAVLAAAAPDRQGLLDVAFNAEISGDPAADAASVRAFAAAGATWWIELAPGDGSPEEYRHRIRRGPPPVA